LELRILGHHAEIHVAVGTCFAASVRAEEIDSLQRYGLVHRSDATRQAVARWLQRGWQVFQSQLHGGNLSRGQWRSKEAQSSKLKKSSKNQAPSSNAGCELRQLELEDWSLF
jgi:hypothetical protein